MVWHVRYVVEKAKASHFAIRATGYNVRRGAYEHIASVAARGLRDLEGKLKAKEVEHATALNQLVEANNMKKARAAELRAQAALVLEQERKKIGQELAVKADSEVAAKAALVQQREEHKVAETAEKVGEAKRKKTARDIMAQAKQESDDANKLRKQYMLEAKLRLEEVARAKLAKDAAVLQEKAMQVKAAAAELATKLAVKAEEAATKEAAKASAAAAKAKEAAAASKDAADAAILEASKKLAAAAVEKQKEVGAKAKSAAALEKAVQHESEIAKAAAEKEHKKILHAHEQAKIAAEKANKAAENCQQSDERAKKAKLNMKMTVWQKLRAATEKSRQQAIDTKDAMKTVVVA